MIRKMKEIKDIIEILWCEGFSKEDLLILIEQCKEIIDYDKQQEVDKNE